LLPDKGTAQVNGFDVVKDYKRIRGIVGYMPGKFSLYGDLSVEENLDFFASVFGTTLQSSYELIKDIYVQLEPFKKRRAGQLSGGMKQKLALCCALIHKPKLLFLDEPTTGVDAVSRREFWEMLKRLKQQGITILVSTAYMDEATLCDRIALLQNGNVLSVDTPDGIIKKYPGQLYTAKADNVHRLLEDTRNYKDTQDCYPFGDSIHLTFKTDDERNGGGLQSYLQQRGHARIEIRPAVPEIEDCFIRLLK
ncbi:MAG: ABC transporter ATP-binding protein, partial [Bacteroidia bacterium]